LAEDQPTQVTPKPGDTVSVVVRHWWQDPVVAVCLLQFVIALALGVQDALNTGGMSSSTFWGVFISALLAVLKARAPEVFTGIQLFDKPHDQRNP